MSKEYYLFESTEKDTTGIGVHEPDQYHCPLALVRLIKVPREGGAADFVYKRPINDGRDVYKGFLVEHNELYELGCFDLEQYYGEEDYDIVLAETDIQEDGDPLFIWFHY